MDPNQTLINIRDLVEEILFGSLSGTSWQDSAESLAEAVENMDEWLTRGGFLPEDWEELRRAQTKTAVSLRDLDSFTLAYLEAALWSSTAWGSDPEGTDDVPMDELFSIEDINEDCLQKMAADCEKFQEENWDDIQDAELKSRYNNDKQAGHDFWLTRNGHGAGFWDGDWPEPQASRLTEASEKFGEFNLDAYVDNPEGGVSC